MAGDVMREFGVVYGTARIVNLHPVDLRVSVNPVHLLVDLKHPFVPIYYGNNTKKLDIIRMNKNYIYGG